MRKLPFVALATILAVPFAVSAQTQTDQSQTVTETTTTTTTTTQTDPTTSLAAETQAIEMNYNELSAYHEPTLKEDQELEKSSTRPDDPSKNPFVGLEDWNLISSFSGGGN